MTPRDATVGSPPTSEDGKAQRASGTPAGQGAKPSAEPSREPKGAVQKIRTEFLDPIRVDTDPARADDTAYVDDVYHEVEGVIQDGMDRLAKRRSFPILG